MYYYCGLCFVRYCYLIAIGGSDRKVVYWEVLDGSLVRELEGSPSGTINTIDISPGGQKFVSGGNDQLVKLWRYQEGIATHIGVGHAAVITCARFSANSKFIVTCDASGSVFVWENPQDTVRETKEEEKATETSAQKTAIKNEEHIRDLPSVRSSKSGGDSKRSKEEEWCKCVSRSSKSSMSTCSERGSGDAAKKSSKCGSQTSVRSRVSNVGSQKSEKAVKSQNSIPDNQERKESSSTKSLKSFVINSNSKIEKQD